MSFRFRPSRCLLEVVSFCSLALLPSSPLLAQSKSLRVWDTYKTIVWTDDTPFKRPEQLPLFYKRMAEMGVNTGMVFGDGDLAPLLTNNQAFYVENMVNRGLCLKFNSTVTDWDKFVTEWAGSGRPESALKRDYCLDDPNWQSWAGSEVERLAGKYSPHRPLAYNLRDELSTTISANPFDYDFNPVALDGFRAWLKTIYTSLEALNAEWETSFANWGEVRPFTTDQIKNRMASNNKLPRGNPDWQALEALRFSPVTAPQESTRWNFSPWCDFRSYMDLSLARALNALRDRIHKVDPATPVGIEGTQMPNTFGGYDLWRLAQSLDWMEPYDIGSSREILGSFMPGKPLLTTVFESDTRHASRRLWHLLLEGDRGCIVWWSQDCVDWKSSHYELTPKAKAIAPVLQEMTSPLAQLFLQATRVYDPIYILYSQPSIQIDWLLESTVDGSTWLRRFSSFEADHNRMAVTREAWLKAWQDLGYSPRFISSEQLAAGFLDNRTNITLVLPSAYALSSAENDHIQRLLTQVSPAGAANTVLADGTPGLFDEHGKLRKTTVANGFLGDASPNPSMRVRFSGHSETSTQAGDITEYAKDRLSPKPGRTWLDWLGKSRAEQPPLKLATRDGTPLRSRLHRFHSGPLRLYAIEQNIAYHMSEDLKQAGGNEGLEKPVKLVATLPNRAHLYDLARQKYLGFTNAIEFDLDPWHPFLLAASDKELDSQTVVQQALATGRPHH